METPSSMRRITRSQAKAAAIDSNKKIEDSEMGGTKSRTRNPKNQQDRFALIDITNDSPIVGVAMETPSSGILKQRSIRAKNTPGSGEALLRGQVKTLLQKVEEEAEISKLSLESRPFLHLKNLVNSPMGLLAPTPANTPQIADLTRDGEISEASPVSEEQEMMISQVLNDIFEGKKGESSLDSQKSLITRSLLLDFSEKSESSSDSWECSSVVTTGCSSVNMEKSTPEDDDASVWSIQVNASTQDEDEEDVIEEEEEEEEDYECYDEEEEDGSWVDELCAGMSKISVKEKGKHIRFVYNSDDELETVEETAESTGASSEVLKLKGWPTPKGKHLRFPLEEDDN